MIRLVKQSTERNCGAACVAMLLGLETADEAEELLGRRCHDELPGVGLDPPYCGVLLDEAARLCWEHGIPTLQSYHSELYREAAPWRLELRDVLHVPDERLTERHIHAGGTAMLGVPSLNTPYGHWIVVSGGKVFDPSTMRTYRDGDRPEIEAALLVAPRRADLLTGVAV